MNLVLFSRVQQVERGEKHLQRRAAESEGRELQTGHEVRGSERGEEHGSDEEQRPAAGGTDLHLDMCTSRKVLMVFYSIHSVCVDRSAETPAEQAGGGM